MDEPRKPDFRLKLKDPESGATSEVGAAWLNSEGYLSIKLNVGVVLSGLEQASRRMHLTLFPVREKS